MSTSEISTYRWTWPWPNTPPSPPRWTVCSGLITVVPAPSFALLQSSSRMGTHNIWLSCLRSSSAFSSYLEWNPNSLPKSTKYCVISHVIFCVHPGPLYAWRPVVSFPFLKHSTLICTLGFALLERLFLLVFSWVVQFCHLDVILNVISSELLSSTTPSKEAN